jgi:flagellar motor protein MotB
MWGPPPPDIDLVRGGSAYADASTFGGAPLASRAGGPVASVMFSSGSSRLAPAADALLRQVAAQYQRAGGTISVIGHASQTSADHNDVRRQIANFSVSMDRATAVARVLQQYGVPGEAIAISAQIDPIAMNDAAGQRADVFLR